MRVRRIEPPVILDTDFAECFASFDQGLKILVDTLEVRTEVYVSDQVMDELSHLYRWRSKTHIVERIRDAVNAGLIGCLKICAVSEDAQLFNRLTSGGSSSLPIMGAGEAAAIVLAKSLSGTVASNNLKDVKRYCQDNGIGLICTEDVISLAVYKEKVTIEHAAYIWDKLKKDGRCLPKYDFYEAYQKFVNGRPL